MVRFILVLTNNEIREHTMEIKKKKINYQKNAHQNQNSGENDDMISI